MHPAIFPDHREFNSLAREPNTPSRLADYVYTDAPQISIHIITFSDATLVSFTWPHYLTDAMGVAAIFHAWSLVLNDEEDRVPDLIGLDANLLNFEDSSETEQYSLADRQLTGLALAIFNIRYVHELFWERWIKEEQGCLCIPAAVFASIKDAELTEIDPSKTVLSDGDVLVVWFTKLVLNQMPWMES